MIDPERIQVKKQNKETVIYQINSINNAYVKFVGTKRDNFKSGMIGIASLAHKDVVRKKLTLEYSGENLELDFFIEK